MIEADDGSLIAIELVDAATNTRVHTLSSASFSRLEIVALDADINEKSWTTEEFNRSILREGKRPLLVGDLTVTLKDGVGVIGGDVAFTDNSSWSRSRKFRLGAKVTGGGVVEAISEAFVCKEHPGAGESYGKHFPPYSDSEVLKLDDIAKSSVTESSFVGGNLSDHQEQQFQMFGFSLSPLSVHKDSHKIKRRHKVIHTTVSDFMNVVQRLTGDVRFPARPSMLMQEDELNIGFEESQSLYVDDGPFADASDVSAAIIKDYDVVIRYRRGDISNEDFISHLRAAFCRRGISVNEEFHEVDAVPECRVLIIFLTSTYVPSNLLNILKHQRKEKYLMSFHWSESELIDELVRDALKVLYSNDNELMIGMDTQVDEILSLLCIDSPDVRSIGIWGTVGIGKTAIAEEIFRRISVQYETCVFLKNLHKEVEVKGHDAVKEEFLSKVLEIEPRVIQVSDFKTSFLRSRIQCKKVLVILDDVNDFRDVETFSGMVNYFGPGSRIIITSRNRRVFVQCKIDHVYEVKPLDISKSLLLLECGRSRSVFLPEVDKTLSLELIKFSNGNPKVLLFLRILVREWKLLSEKFQKTSPIFIPGIFQRICCDLDDYERSIFLDIACFFRRMDKDGVAMLLDGCGFSAHVGFRGLVDKSLLTISHNMVDMLRFIEATGREIVRQESPDRPGDRSRLWNSEDIRNVFMHDSGTSAIESIFLDMSKLKMDGNPYVFKKMCNLRLLKFYCSEEIENRGVSLPQGLEYLPSKQRLLHWEYYPLSSLPQSFDPMNLVELNLPNSSAKKLWKGKKAMLMISSLEQLKKMRLSYSYQLAKIPRLSSALNLEHIDLEGCNSLVSISKSVSSLRKLVFLNLKDCSNLESIPSTVELESLEVLNLSGCSKLEIFPEISPNVKQLYMGGTMIQEIPSSIKNLVLLEKLDLENSRHLVTLPTTICKLKHLETLNLSGCSSLERFPDLYRKMKCLKSLDLSRTAH
ncbi:hypothetical protein EUTSA_v10028393mg [Eutrema salsugineum]|uniref:NB-ARC domain-containing protein n=1 Tax=Eutrema salsugineum TaxID=72664 RepID=V4KK65_EUTSA|nr:hypothetical protein EUTSA_v10028393mg [Eutrema salsugineum]